MGVNRFPAKLGVVQTTVATTGCATPTARWANWTGIRTSNTTCRSLFGEYGDAGRTVSGETSSAVLLRMCPPVCSPIVGLGSR